MPIRIALLILCLLALGTERAEAQFNRPNPAVAENFHVELSAMFWTPTPEVNIQTGGLAAIGEDSVDFVTEFGIENKRFREFRGVVKMARKHKLRFNYVPIEYTAEAILARQIEFGGQIYDVGIPVTAEFGWELWKIGYEWDLAAGDRAFFGIIGELKINKISAALETPLMDAELSEVNAPVPTLGAIGRIYPTKDLSVTVEFTGIKLPDGFTDQFDATLYDFDLYGTYNFGKYAGVQGGYRSLIAEYGDDDDAGKLKMKGWYFGGLIRF